MVSKEEIVTDREWFHVADVNSPSTCTCTIARVSKSSCALLKLVLAASRLSFMN